MATVETVADSLDTDPLNLPPLATYVDPSALDRILRTSDDVTIQFDYDGIDVLLVKSTDHVTVRCRP